MLSMKLTLGTTAAVLMLASAAQSQTIYYSLPDAPQKPQMTLGQMIAYRAGDPSLDQFRQSISSAQISGSYNPDKGLTVFAPSDYSSNNEYYIVNDRIAVSLLRGTKTVRTIDGKEVLIVRNGNSVYANNQLITDSQSVPEGLIYTTGGLGAVQSRAAKPRI